MPLHSSKIWKRYNPFPPALWGLFSKLTLPLIPSLCFLSEVGTKVVAQIQEGRWETGLPPSLSQLTEERKRLYKAPGLTLQKSLFNLLRCAHMEEWGILRGKQQPWRCLYNWGHLTVSLVGAFSSPYCLWAFPLSSFRSLLWHTDSNKSNT